MATIDVNEILRSSFEPVEKRSRTDFVKNISTENSSTDEILAALERDNSQNECLDESAVKRISLQLEKKFSKNREMRVKYGDEPQKFMDSEVELNTAIQEMHSVAAHPELYNVIVEQGVIQILLQLLGHENTDIVSAVCNLLQELTDVEILNDGEENAEILVSELMNCQIIETLLQQSILRLNEDVQDEADAVHNALSVVENILDFRPEASEVCIEQGLFQWLLTKATKKSAFDANKLFSSQLLHMLLQTSETARKKLCFALNIDGIDLLLRALASYKRHDPQSPDEFEHMENLFDALCASLLYVPNRQVFLDGEGLQLMNLMLREKKQSREGALKVLSYATSIPDGAANCDKFVEIFGLRTLFPLFMRTPSKTKRKDTTPDEHEEHVCSVIDALLFLCNETNKKRVSQKFLDHGCEKIDRCVELFIKYSERVNKFMDKFSNKILNINELSSEETYIEKLNSGFFTLERVALILAEVCVYGPGECKERAAKLFRMKLKNASIIHHLNPVLSEFYANLGDNAEIQRQRVDTLVFHLNTISEKN